MSAIRKRLESNPAQYKPKWDGLFIGYASNYMNKHLWRLARTHDFDDAMSEAYIVFRTCELKYKGEVDNPAWFMALFKTALANRVTDLATESTRTRSVGTCMSDLAPNDEEEATLPEAVGELANEGELRVMVRQAPSEVRTVLCLLLNAPSEIIDMVTASWTARGKKSPFANARLCKMLGLPEDTDVLEEIRSYFS